MESITLVYFMIIAFLFGMEGELDKFQFHRTFVAYTLISIVSANLLE